MKIHFFRKEFVCFRDVSLDAILSHPGANLDPFLPNLGGYLVRILADLPPVWTNLRLTWANLHPTLGNLQAF